MSVSVSAVIKARNEAHQIAEAIESASLLANEVLVVDDASVDDTVAIAERCGARVMSHQSVNGRIDELDKVGIAVARGDWVLRLDADERLTPELADHLRQVATEGRYSSVAFARRNLMFGDWPRHGGWFVAHQIGFFRKRDFDPAWPATLHSQVPVVGPTLRLPATPALSTLHYDYDDVQEFVRRTLATYARVEAVERFGAGTRFKPHRVLLAPARRFVGRYVVRQGFRDGARGLVLAGLLAAYDMAIECHLWDLERKEHAEAQSGVTGRLENPPW